MKINELSETAAAEMTSAGSIASSMGGGNGFLNGGPGTLTRSGSIKTKVLLVLILLIKFNKCRNFQPGQKFSRVLIFADGKYFASISSILTT